MLTRIQLTHLAGYVCPSCAKLLGRYHAYPVRLPTLISGLADSVPMHLECAHSYHDLETSTDVTAVWVVKSSSPNSPSGRLFERTPGEWFIHLFSPERIDLFRDGRPATYDEIQEAMLPVIKQALEAAGSEDEVEKITRQVATLHRYLPPRPKPPKTSPSP